MNIKTRSKEIILNDLSWILYIIHSLQVYELQKVLLIEVWSMNRDLENISRLDSLFKCFLNLVVYEYDMTYFIYFIM